MIRNKENQSAKTSGDNSPVIQADNLTIGIDEKRVREIFDEKIQSALLNFSNEAVKEGMIRVEKFKESLIPKLINDGLLQSLKDPAIQIQLLEAQKTAAQTERELDYQLLTELLIHRIKKNDDRQKRTGIKKAVEIVDEITDNALLALTATHAIEYFLPITGNIKHGIKVLNDILFEKIINDNSLPKNDLWLDQLDILNAIRMNPFGGLKKIDIWYSEKLQGYIDNGIKKDTDNYSKALEIIKKYNLPANIFVEHELNNEYYRLSITNINNVDKFYYYNIINLTNGQKIQQETQYTDLQKDKLREIYGLYEKDAKVKQENIKAFIQEWDKYPALKTLREWWDGLKTSFSITAVGKVLAHSNAQRISPTLPPLD